MSVDLSFDVKRGSVIVVGGIVGLLLSANLFFIKRLVDELDESNQRSLSMQARMEIVQYRLDRIENTLHNKEN